MICIINLLQHSASRACKSPNHDSDLELFGSVEASWSFPIGQFEVELRQIW
jgi:hypothetical protein